MQIVSMLAAAVLLAGCGASSAQAPQSSTASTGTAKGQKTLAIPALLPLSGAAAFQGQKEQQALKVLQNQINQSGGVRGALLRFSVQDTQSSPQVAVQDLATLHGAPVVLGPSLTSTCNAVDATITSQMVDYCLSPVIHPKPHSYVFSAMEPAPDLVQADLNFLKQHHWTRIAVISSNDASGHAFTAITKKLLAKPAYANIHATTFQFYDDNATNVNAQVAKMMTTKPQVVFAWATGTPIGVAFRGISQSSLDHIPVFMDAGNMTNSELRQYAGFLPQQLYVATGAWPAGASLPPGKEQQAIQQFDRGFAAIGQKPDIGDAEVWDAALLVIAAYRHDGLHASASAIHRFIESQSHFHGIFGTYNFTNGDQRGLSLKDSYVYRWNPAHTAWILVSGAGG